MNNTEAPRMLLHRLVSHMKLEQGGGIVEIHSSRRNLVTVPQAIEVAKYSLLQRAYCVMSERRRKDCGCWLYGSCSAYRNPLWVGFRDSPPGYTTDSNPVGQGFGALMTDTLNLCT